MKPLAALLIPLLAVAALAGRTHAQSNACHQGFRFENVSSVSNGSPSVEGMPAVLYWAQTNAGARDDVFARSADGALVHYYCLAGGGWTGENLSTMTGVPSVPIQSNPVAVLGRQRIGTQYCSGSSPTR